MKFSTFWLKIGHQKSRIFGIALFGWKKSNTNEPNLNLNIRVSKCYEMDQIRMAIFTNYTFLAEAMTKFLR